MNRSPLSHPWVSAELSSGVRGEGPFSFISTVVECSKSSGTGRKPTLHWSHFTDASMVLGKAAKKRTRDKEKTPRRNKLETE
ncbi:uncharacterized [Tachysurus ichikawai]